EDLVEPLARVGQDLHDLLQLLLGPRLADLLDGAEDLEPEAAKLDRRGARAAGDLLPGCRLGRPALGLGPALVGQRVAVAALGLLGRDEPLVLEHLQRRIDGAGARLPDAAGALADLLDDLVPVHRSLRQQGEDRGPHVAAPRAAAHAVAPAGSERLSPGP